MMTMITDFKIKTPYMEILKVKGDKYLRGWARADYALDPKGATKRAAQFRKSI